MGYEALLQIEAETGAGIAYSENVTNIDLKDALRDYAVQGYDVVFGLTSGFQGDMLSVGDEFPDTKFVIIAGSEGNDTNVSSWDAAPWQYGYSLGYMAGKVTTSGKIGYIATGEGVSTYNALVGGWKDGAKAGNPDVEGTVIYIVDNDDIAAAREATEGLISAGCDVIMHELNRASQGVMDVCKQNGVITIGRSADDITFAPDVMLTYANFGWDQNM